MTVTVAESLRDETVEIEVAPGHHEVVVNGEGEDGGERFSLRMSAAAAREIATLLRAAADQCDAQPPDSLWK